jgi:hypothetical protein
VVPSHERRADPLEAGEGDVELDRARTGNVRVGQDESVVREDDARTDARVEAARALLKGHLPHVDPDDRIEQRFEARTQPGGGRRQGAEPAAEGQD